MEQYGLQEDEIQVLIALLEVSMPIETPHNTHYTFYPKTLTEAAEYFHHNLLSWESAYMSLQEKQLISRNNHSYCLSPTGIQQAETLRQQRPPIYYWYRTLYRAIPSSQAFAQFCEEVYGVNWQQHGFSDLQQIQLLLDSLSLRPQQTVLDVGCGSGRFTEYLADRFELRATGVDYCDAAIQLARERTLTKRDRLSFFTQNIDAISFPPHSFDAIISIDSLGFVAGMEKTLSTLYTLLKDRGKLAIFWFAITDKPQEEFHLLEPDGTPVALAFNALGIKYEVSDLSEENWRILQLRHAAALRHKDRFMAEGNQFLFENLLRESEPDTTSFSRETCHIRRFLYLATK